MENIEVLKRRLEREIRARKEAEEILEAKSRELYEANRKLQDLNLSLEQEVVERTEDLLERKRQFKELVELANDIIFNADPRGNLTYVNPAGIRMLGYSEQELLEKQYFELIRESDQSRVRDFYRRMVDHQQTSSYLEFPVVLKDGSTKWLGQMLRITYENDRPDRLMAVARDIQELRDTRIALENSEKKYRGIIEGMELGLMEVSSTGKAVFVNYWFCEMTGYTPAEVIGQDPDILFLNEEGREMMKQQNRNREKGRSGVYEIQIRRKSGDMIWVAISGAPIFNRDGEVIGTVGMHLDITPQKQLQAQLQDAIKDAEEARMAEKAFLAHMSHEIRTPLNAVMGMANLLASTRLSAEQEEYVNDMLHASDVLHGLISDILDISKIEAGEVEVNKTPVDLPKTLGMIIKTMEYRARDQGNVLQFKAPDDLPRMVMVDRIILHQVLINLLDNANKFTKNGSIGLKISASKSESEGPCVIEFEVSDTGIGIAEDRLNRIFDRFQQIKDSQSNLETRGTGLGLSISKSLVELHGGRIQARSTPGKGSVFCFSLEVDEYSSPEDSNNGSGNSSAKTLEDIKVLAAEDSYLTRKYLQGLFSQWKLKYDMVEDGLQALEASRKAKYDLILMDMQMPGMDGYQATELIRQDDHNPNQQSPILALTASALMDERDKALRAGMDDHLTKPFTPFQLRDFMERNLEMFGMAPHFMNKKVSFRSLDLPDLMNPDLLDEMYLGDMEHAQRMFSLFIGMIGEELMVAEGILDRQDHAAAKTWLHKIGPTLGMVGLSSYQSKFMDLETSLVSEKDWERNREVIAGMIGKLRSEIPAIEAVKLILEKL